MQTDPEHLAWFLTPMVLAVIIGIVGVALIIKFYRIAWDAPAHRSHWWVIITGIAFSVVSWSISGLFVLGLARMDLQVASGFDPYLTMAHLVLAPVLFTPVLHFRIFPKTRAMRIAAGAVLGALLMCSGLVAIANLDVPGRVEISLGHVVFGAAWCTGSLACLAGSFDNETAKRRKLFAGVVGFVNVTILLLIMSFGLRFTSDPSVSVPPDSISGNAFIAMNIGFITICLIAGATFTVITRMSGADMLRDYKAIAMQDHLTGLPNRLHLHEQVEAYLAQKGGGQISLVSFDLDNFKPINDAFGHLCGDATLRAVAGRILSCLEEDAFCARVGGDEFTAVLWDADPHKAFRLARRLSEAIRKPLNIRGTIVMPSASFGIVTSRGRNASLEHLVCHADMALYHAKSDAHLDIVVFEPGMLVAQRRKKLLETRIAAALENEEFDLHYQPQLDLATGETSCLEALIRWHDPHKGLVSPAEFIPAAEASGLIHRIGLWSIERACRDKVDFGWPVPVAVNISPIELLDPAFCGAVGDILRRYRMGPGDLEFELTEVSPPFIDKSVSGNIAGLTALGISLSMDDYGTGHASLGSLRSLPFSKIKIDGSFVRALGEEDGTIDIIRSVILLGRALGIPVVAEGVETEGQETILKAEGCDFVQGYRYARPMPAGMLGGIGGAVCMSPLRAQG